MGNRPADRSNLAALDRFWRRSPFHDELIEEITAINKRVVIRLTDLTFVITAATDLKRCELPAVWLRESIVSNGDRFILDIETDTGQILLSGHDIRLIRNRDMAVLIPPIDA